MKIITCASYYGTGSSAVTDYISEFDSVASLGDYEFRFLHDTDGIADLEYHLVWNHNRHNSGHALKRFKKLVDFQAGSRLVPRYEPFFGGRWRELAYKYIDALTDFTYKGWWQYDLLDKGIPFYYRKQLLSKLYRMTVARGTEKYLNVLPNEITYCSHPSEEYFTAKTKEFLSELLRAGNRENKEYLMVDQLLPSSNLDRFWKFFEDDIKAIVVERDPRDLYILEKFVWKGTVIPTENAEVFCKWYKYTRAHRSYETFNPEHALLIQFEDLIYKYDEATKVLRDFLGLEEEKHIAPLSKLDPSRSIKNTRLWEKYDIGEELSYIENELKDYLYDYSFLEVDNEN